MIAKWPVTRFYSLGRATVAGQSAIVDRCGDLPKMEAMEFLFVQNTLIA
jgi:hypothetical protein